VRLQFIHPGIVGTPLPFRLLLTLEYRGDSKTSYRTCLAVERTLMEYRQRVRATWRILPAVLPRPASPSASPAFSLLTATIRPFPIATLTGRKAGVTRGYLVASCRG